MKAAPNATASASFTISNTGKGPLTASVTAPMHSPPFTELNGGGPIAIGAGGSHQVTIVYSPTTKGSTNDDVLITSTGAGQKKPIKVKIKGKSKVPKK